MPLACSARRIIISGATRLLNPIEQERMEMIRKWVSENSTQTPSSGGQGGAPVGAATSGDLFNRIFDKLRRRRKRRRQPGTTRCAPKSFRLESVPNEGK